jgi:hypothetical protein
MAGQPSSTAAAAWAGRMFWAQPFTGPRRIPGVARIRPGRRDRAAPAPGSAGDGGSTCPAPSAACRRISGAIRPGALAPGPGRGWPGGLLCRAHCRGIVRASQAGGGLLTAEDLADTRAEWVTPCGGIPRAPRLPCPPNSQGIATLLALQILAGFDLQGVAEVDRLHLMVEAKKLAFCRPGSVRYRSRLRAVPTERLLAPRTPTPAEA